MSQSIQFRVGKRLLSRVDQAARAAKSSRNSWIEAAVRSILDPYTPVPTSMTASDLLCDKKTVLVRIDPELVAEVDLVCKKNNIDSRTIFMLDACVSRLAGANNGVG